MDKKEGIMFLGDLLLCDQPVLYGFGFDSMYCEHYSDAFENVKQILSSYKFVVANFEAVIKDRSICEDSVTQWSMCCDENICGALIESGINIVSIANNHTCDYGLEWYGHTVDNLEKSGIVVIGKKEKPYEVFEIDNRKTGIVAASYLKVGSIGDPPYLFYPTKEDWKSIFAGMDADLKIAYIHWGSEFIESPTVKQEEMAREIIEAGADAIIGHHPHIIQDNRMIDSKPVFFSLGNFVSDYWQKRLRKTAAVVLDGNGNFSVQKGIIDKTYKPSLSDNLTAPIFRENNKSSSKRVFLERMRMRLEYFAKIVFNFHRIRNKKAFIKWMTGRFKYILKFMFKEIKNSDVIYENYNKKDG